MKLKLDEKGNVVVKDGMPVYVHEDGSEVAFDAPGTVATIKRLNGEAKGHREAKEAAELKLKGFAGIEDPAAALKALETVGNLDAGKLSTAEQVQKIKDEAVKAAEARITQLTKTHNEVLAAEVQKSGKLENQLHEALIGGAFANSKVVTDKFAIPGDIVRATFGGSFKVEDGQVVAYKNGERIGSRQKIGEPAGFDEALEIIVGDYAHRDAILKGRGGGTGTGSGAGGQGGGAKTISRSQFQALSPDQQMAKVRTEGYTVVDG